MSKNLVLLIFNRSEGNSGESVPPVLQDLQSGGREYDDLQSDNQPFQHCKC